MKPYDGEVDCGIEFHVYYNNQTKAQCTGHMHVSISYKNKIRGNIFFLQKHEAASVLSGLLHKAVFPLHRKKGITALLVLGYSSNFSL